MVTRHNLPAVAGLLVALGLPFIFGLYLGSVREQLADPSKVIQALVMQWGAATVLLLIMLLWERQPLSSIGIRKMGWRDVLWAVVGFLIGAVSFIVTTPIVTILGLGTAGIGITQLAQVPIMLRVAIVFTASVTEEILFRGYPIERLNVITGRIGLGAVIAYIAFVLLHVPFWGVGGAVQIGVWALVVTVLYVNTRNLPACMLMHGLNDAYAFILLPIFFVH